MLTTVDAALSLARALHARGETELAFRTAEHGLTLQGRRYALATWLRDAAVAARETERAVAAARAAVKEAPRLTDYKGLQQLAGECWSGLRDKILDDLRHSDCHDTSGIVDIFVHEGLLEDAVHAVRGSWDFAVVIRVVEAAASTHPLKAVAICREQAARIMDGGKADLYRHAARWVQRARDAYRVAGQENQSQDYKAALLADHSRKYKLIPMLRDL